MTPIVGVATVGTTGIGVTVGVAGAVKRNRAVAEIPPPPASRMAVVIPRVSVAATGAAGAKARSAVKGVPPRGVGIRASAFLEG